MPGFVDSHMHLFFESYTFKVLKLHGIEGIKALTNTIRSFVTAHPDDTLLVAEGLNCNAFDDGKDAARHIVDSIFDNRALLFQSSDFHIGWASTIALSQTGIMHGLDLGPGSRFELGNDGTATGVLTEPPAAFRTIPNKLANVAHCCICQNGLQKPQPNAGCYQHL